MGSSGKLCKYNKKVTLSSREVQTAVRLVLPGDLAKYAVSEGTKAMNDQQKQYLTSKNNHSFGGGLCTTEERFPLIMYEDDEDDEDDDDHQSTSISAKAGLIFPVGRIARYLKKSGFANGIGG